MLATIFRCKDGHQVIIAGREPTEAELKEFEKCIMPGCQHSMQRKGGNPPAAPGASRVQTY